MRRIAGVGEAGARSTRAFRVTRWRSRSPQPKSWFGALGFRLSFLAKELGRGAARLKLDRLEAAMSRGDLAALPGNRFESLHGDRKGQHSIRINDQWRICFEWPDKAPGPSNVEIVDYH
jgi:toxin HigB-1